MQCTSLFQVKQKELWTTANLCLEHLIKLGFDHQFFNVEFFILQNGQIKLMEINGRMNRITPTLCSNMLEGGDCFEAIIALGKGVSPLVPTLKQDAGFAIRFYLTTFGTGLLEEFLDFEKIENFPNVEVNLEAGHQIKQNGGEGGNIFGFADVYGKDLNNCVQKMDDIKMKLLKNPEFSPWFGH